MISHCCYKFLNNILNFKTIISDFIMKTTKRFSKPTDPTNHRIFSKIGFSPIKRVLTVISFSIYLLIIAQIVSLLLISRPSTTYAQSENTLYISQDCAYCKSVSDFIEIYNINNEVNFITIIVSDEATANQLSSTANSCNITNPQVPLFYYEGLCYMGDSAVINKLIDLTGNEIEYQTENETETSTEEVDDNNDEIPDTETGTELNTLSNSSEQSKTEKNTNKDEISENSNILSAIDNEENIVSSQSSNPKTPFINILVIVIAPLSFIALFFLIIKALKL